VLRVGQLEGNFLSNSEGGGLNSMREGGKRRMQLWETIEGSGEERIWEGTRKCYDLTGGKISTTKKFN